jgi:hypothetical protein
VVQLRRIAAAALVAAMASMAAGCGDDAGAGPTAGEPGGTTAATASPTTATPTTANVPAAGQGSATLTIGDDTWAFDRVRCAFGEEQIRQEGAVFVLSATGDGLQLMVSIDSWGHIITLDDIADFANPSLGWSAGDPVHRLFADAGDFISLDGTRVSATADFRDTVSGAFEFTPGELRAVCP